MMPLAVQAAMAAIEKICPEAKNLLVIPENHTRNTFYLENVHTLMRIFRQAGLNVRLGSLDETVTEPMHLKLPSGGELVVEPLIRNKLRLGLKDFDPCTILLNNDLSGGIPPILQGLHEQYLLPPLHAGWACGASPSTSTRMTMWRKNSPSSSASIRGCSTPTSPSAARSTSTSATVKTVWPKRSTAC
jgi:Glutamate-cysteine ligase.